MFPRLIELLLIEFAALDITAFFWDIKLRIKVRIFLIKGKTISSSSEPIFSALTYCSIEFKESRRLFNPLIFSACIPTVSSLRAPKATRAASLVALAAEKSF